MSGSLEINVDTRDFERLQATLARIDANDLDKLLRATVNSVASKADRLIQQQVSAELGLLPHQIDSRMQLNRSDARPHAVRSAWMWYGKHRLSGTRLARQMGADFKPGQVQVGKFIWRHGFFGHAGTKIDGVLMQRLTNDSYPIRPAMASTAEIVQEAINRVSPSIPALLEGELEKRVAAYLAKL